MATEQQEKYQKLAAEYSKLRSQVTVLKKAVVDEQTKREGLEEDLKNRDVSLRKLQQEVDSFSFRNQQLSSRVEILQSELDAAQTVNKKNKNQKVQPAVSNHVDTSVFGEELQSKIQENMQLHSQIIEMEGSYKEQVKDLSAQLSLLKAQQQNFQQVLDDTESKQKLKIEKLQDKRIELELAIHQKEAEVKEQKAKVHNLEKQVKALQGSLGKDLEAAKAVIKFNIPFNETVSSPCKLSLDLLSPDLSWHTWIQGTISQVQELVCDLVQGYCDLLTYWEQRVGIFPVDPQWEEVSEDIKKSKQLLHRTTEFFRPIEKSMKRINETASTLTIITLESLQLDNLSLEIQGVSLYLQDLLPLQLHCLEEESALSMCPENLLLKNRTVATAQSQLYLCFQYISQSFALLSLSKSRSDQEFAINKLCDVVDQLATITYEFSQLYHAKVALEHSLATTSHKLKVTNECILKVLSSIVNTTNKLNEVMSSSRAPLLTHLSNASHQSSALSHPCSNLLAQQATGYLQSLREKPCPASIPQADGLHAYRTLHSSTESQASLAQQVQTLQKQVTQLEQDKEHWLLESRLLQAKLERKDSDDVKATGEGDQKTNSVNRESMIKEHYTKRVAEMTNKLQASEGKVLAFYAECKAVHFQLASVNEEREQLLSKVQESSNLISSLQDELQTTSTGYNEQLSTLSEHLAAMNDKLAHQQDEIQELKAKQTKGIKRSFLPRTN